MMEVGTQAADFRRGTRCAMEWLASPDGRRFAFFLLALLAGQVAFAALETLVLGLSFVRESPANFAPYQVGQSLFILAAVAGLVSTASRARAADSRIGQRTAGFAALAVGMTAIAAGAAATALFIVDPDAFHAGAQEDRPLEWASALLLFGAAAWAGVTALRRRASLVVAGMVGLIGLALLLVGLEEISWGQRLFGFATPETLAEVNWQAEFNLHNIQTDLSEAVYYAGSAFFLVLAPLIGGLLPAAAADHPLAAWIPSRGVALAAAPAIWINYGDWNIYAIQLVTVAALAAYLVWAVAAWRRGDAKEAAAFLIAAVAATAGQLLFLAFGPAMIELPDSTEYKEFFIALAFAAYVASFGASAISGVAGD